MRTVVILLFLVSWSISAQTPGTCSRGTASGDLDVGGSEVFARVFNEGNLFFGGGTTYGNGYLVPREKDEGTIFSSGLWIGGKVHDELRVAAARYTRWEFWPGPLEQGAVLPDPADCSAYDRIFVVSRDDIRRYLQTGVATADLKDWPVAWGAPVLDGDGVEGNYNLEGGDQPAIYGGQTAWWVMNDVGNVHAETGSNPLGVEVQVSAFLVGSGIRALKEASFYRYRITNQNSIAIDSMHVSLYSDFWVGYYQGDEWIGSDTTLALGFGYNGYNDDGIGGIPPAQGFQIVQGPVSPLNGRDDDRDGDVDEPDERMDLSAFTYWCNGCPGPATRDPRTATEYYNHMNGRWKDGTPFTASGFGYQSSGLPTIFVFPADPVTEQCWSMRNNCEGGSLQPSYLRLAIHTGPFRLSPGESTEVVIALPYAQGSDFLDSVTQLRNAAFATRQAWQSNVLAPRRVEAASLEPFDLLVSPPYPNPFTDHTTIRYELSEAMATRLAVYDVLGREVAVMVDAQQPAGSYDFEFNGADLAPGMYVVRFEAAGEERTFSVVKLR